MIENSKKAIEKIHEFERFGSILGLERMNDLLKLLGNPHEDLKVIHVAGTNGKAGTTSNSVGDCFHADIFTVCSEPRDIRQEYIFHRS